MTSKPKYFAALDLGSNSFHLLIAKVGKGKIEFVYREKRLMRVFEKNSKANYIISDEKMSEAIELLKYFTKIIEKYPAEIFAVATSAIRDAANSLEFVNRIEGETGITVKIISGDEEAGLALISLQYSIKNLPPRYLLFDLGGGSTEFIFVNGTDIVKQFSLPIGAVRCTNMFSKTKEGNIDSDSAITDYIKTTLSQAKEFASSFTVDKCYGMGGTVSSVSLMIAKNILYKKTKYEQLRGFAFGSKELDQLSKYVNSFKTMAERSKIVGLEESRVDIIPAGLIILQTFFSELNVDSITFALTGLREGIIINTIKHL